MSDKKHICFLPPPTRSAKSTLIYLFTGNGWNRKTAEIANTFLEKSFEVWRLSIPVDDLTDCGWDDDEIAELMKTEFGGEITRRPLYLCGDPLGDAWHSTRDRGTRTLQSGDPCQSCFFFQTTILAALDRTFFTTFTLQTVPTLLCRLITVFSQPWAHRFRGSKYPISSNAVARVASVIWRCQLLSQLI